MAPPKASTNLLRPLLARPGARFTCFSDGLCCTDIHALGPITRPEAKALGRLIPGSVEYHSGVKAVCMRAGEGGACAQRENGLCGVHAHHGVEAKPVGCRRFPYGLLMTPEGGRVTTEHRCPCRNMGDRPPVDLVDAERSLRNAGGRLEADHRAPAKIPIAAGRLVSFARYREAESKMIDALVHHAARPEEVLGATVLPELSEGVWQMFAVEFYDLKDETAGGIAVCWYADALLHLSEGLEPPRRARPWAPSFEKALERSKQPEDPEVIINDWIADELWMMRWLDWDCTFDVARCELATRLAAVRYLQKLIEGRGVRPDQAVSEAIMIVEVAAAGEHWGDVVAAIANFPSPASKVC